MKFEVSLPRKKINLQTSRHCDPSIGNTKVTYRVFVGDESVLAGSPEVQEVACNTLHEEVGLRVFWTKAKAQAFGGLPKGTIQSVHARGEDIDNLKISPVVP